MDIHFTTVSGESANDCYVIAFEDKVLADMWVALKALNGFELDSQFLQYLLQRENNRLDAKDVSIDCHITLNRKRFQKKVIRDEVTEAIAVKSEEKAKPEDYSADVGNGREDEPSGVVVRKVVTRSGRKCSVLFFGRKQFNEQPPERSQDKDKTKQLKKEKIISGKRAYTRYDVEPTNTGPRPYSCEKCPKQFKSKYNLKDHMRVHSDRLPYACDLCDETFRWGQQLKAHKLLHTGLKYKCDECDKAFIWKNEYAHHKLKHGGLKPFICSTCGKAFTTASLVKIHENTHDKPFKCPQCPKSFLTQLQLSAHLCCTHNGPRAYICCHCKKAFSGPQKLTQHLRIHTGEKPFKCPICHKSFTLRHILRSHLRIHVETKPHGCQTCGKGFRDASSLKVHEKIHSKEYSHVCETCSKPFIYLESYKRHLRTHTGERPYSCCRCEKRFRDNTGLARHIKMHIKNDRLFSKSTVNPVPPSLDPQPFSELPPDLEMPVENDLLGSDSFPEVPSDDPVPQQSSDIEGDGSMQRLTLTPFENPVMEHLGLVELTNESGECVIIGTAYRDENQQTVLVLNSDREVGSSAIVEALSKSNLPLFEPGF